MRTRQNAQARRNASPRQNARLVPAERAGGPPDREPPPERAGGPPEREPPPERTGDPPEREPPRGSGGRRWPSSAARYGDAPLLPVSPRLSAVWPVRRPEGGPESLRGPGCGCPELHDWPGRSALDLPYLAPADPPCPSDRAGRGYFCAPVAGPLVPLAPVRGPLLRELSERGAAAREAPVRGAPEREPADLFPPSPAPWPPPVARPPDARSGLSSSRRSRPLCPARPSSPVRP